METNGVWISEILTSENLEYTFKKYDVNAMSFRRVDMFPIVGIIEKWFFCSVNVVNQTSFHGDAVSQYFLFKADIFKSS